MSLHALIPPCAQTECERFTGTIENRSTFTPSSASLMVQASPASPPPTTMTRFLDAVAIASSVTRASSPVHERQARAGRPCYENSPHFLAHRRALGVDELQVVFQVV